MSEEKSVICPLCRAENAAGAEVCGACGVRFVAARDPVSPLAKAAAALGALSVLSLGLASVVAIPVGIAALGQLAWSRGRRRGWILATLGTLTSLVTFAILPYPFIARELAGGHKAQCLANTKGLAMALSMYEEDHHSFPSADHWRTETADYFRSAAASAPLTCPRARDPKRSYAYNRGIAGRTDDTIGAPAYAVGFFESDAGENAVGGKELLPATPRHLGGDSYGFSDGHAKWCVRRRLAGEPRQWYRETQPELLWSPAAPVGGTKGDHRK